MARGGRGVSTSVELRARSGRMAAIRGVQVPGAVVTLPAGRDQPGFVELLGRGQAGLPTIATEHERAPRRQLAGWIAQQATAAPVTLLVVAWLRFGCSKPR